jgi:ribosome biogenesis GTPase
MKESNGRIIFASKNRYKVLSEDGCEYICSLSGKFGSESQIMPAVGDHVVFMADDRGASIISSVKERRGLISRKASGTDRGEQVIAAHVDYLFIINAMAISSWLFCS